jgi:DNA excision repair protein ERCC-4
MHVSDILISRDPCCNAFINVDMSSQLHRAIAKKLIESGNCLGVLGSGLCESATVAAIINEFLSQYPNIHPLIIVLGDEIRCSATTITGETSITARDKIYTTGGVVIVTERVLLSDLLSNRLDAALITMMLIPRVHALSETSNEAFIARIFRERNHKGLLIALTEKPHVIASCLDHIVRFLFLSDIVAFPRFHQVVQESLSQTAVDLVEHDVNFSIHQVEIQASIVALIESCIVEMRKSRSDLELDENITSKLVSNHNELQILRRRLDSVWMKLSWTTRQIVSDLSVLRQILVGVNRYHPVHLVSILLSHQQIASRTSPWWLSDDARRLVQLVKQRGGIDKEIKDIKSLLLRNDHEDVVGTVIETPPKWTIIHRIVESLFSQVGEEKRIRRSFKDVKMLIVCPDEVSQKEIESFASEGASRSLLEALKRHLGNTNGILTDLVQQAHDSVPTGSLIDARGDGRCQISVSAHLFKPDELLTELSNFFPEVIVLMEPSLIAIRTLEVFVRMNDHLRLGTPSFAVHILGSSQCLVEPQFPDLIRKENQAFDDIIKMKKTISFYARNELFEQTRNATAAVGRTTSSRQGGSRRLKTQLEVSKQSILVDTRELRSALPFMLYKKGLHIHPTTLSIGDYILSRDIAIERKSVTGSDLQQSLKSGRLYKQLVNMTHAFPWPMLLLEFSTGKSFQLEATDSISGEINPSSLIAQIAALIIHFPSLRLIWSPSFQFTASVFSKLKSGREQPSIDPDIPGKTAMPDPVSQATSSSSKRAIEFLKACPGVTAANLPSILKRTKSIRGLVELGESEIISIMGKRDGNVFIKFINNA